MTNHQQVAPIRSRTIAILPPSLSLPLSSFPSQPTLHFVPLTLPCRVFLVSQADSNEWSVCNAALFLMASFDRSENESTCLSPILFLSPESPWLVDLWLVMAIIALRPEDRPQASWSVDRFHSHVAHVLLGMSMKPAHRQSLFPQLNTHSPSTIHSCSPSSVDITHVSTAKRMTSSDFVGVFHTWSPQLTRIQTHTNTPYAALAQLIWPIQGLSLRILQRHAPRIFLCS